MKEIPALVLPFDAALPMPGSKSHANRALVLASLAPGRTTITGATPVDDVRLLVENLQRMGFRLRYTDVESGTLEVEGGVPERPPDGPVVLDCGLAGTTLRFLCAVAALTPGEWVLTGNARMQERPIGPLTAALQQLGVTAHDRDGRPPVTIRGGTLRGTAVALDATLSSQFASALMLIGAALPHGLTIRQQGEPTSPTYLELTRRVLADFGASATFDAGTIRVAGGLSARPSGHAIEGDWSAAGAWLALAEHTGSRFRGTNLRADSSQGDRLLPDVLARLREPGDLTIDVTAIPDQTMNLAAVAAMRPGTTVLTGAANLRHKECDRLAVTATQLARLGVEIVEHPDGLVVRGPSALRPAVLETMGDHRMAMAFAVLGSLCGGVVIDDDACVAKSYPRFFADLDAARRSTRCVALVGMRGAGKTAVGRCIARELGVEHVDTDQVFAERFAPVAEFVERAGWPAFRTHEAEIVAEVVRPGRIVSLGGGTLDTPANRTVVAERATVVWLQEDVETLVTRIARSNRPAVTDLPLEEEVPELIARRSPTWQELADVVLPPGGSIAARAAAIVSALRRWRP